MFDPAVILHKNKVIELLAKIPLKIEENSGSFSVITEKGEVFFENEKGSRASFGMLEDLTVAQVSRLYDLALAQDLLLKKPSVITTGNLT